MKTAGVSYDVIFANDLPLKEDDTILKGSVAWTPNDDLLFYRDLVGGLSSGRFQPVR